MPAKASGWMASALSLRFSQASAGRHHPPEARLPSSSPLMRKESSSANDAVPVKLHDLDADPASAP